MAANKSYTKLEQSKKLAAILPLESADMYWSRCTITDFGDGALKVSYAIEPCNISQFRNTKEDIPCWSLAALLGVLPNPSLHQTKDGKWYCTAEPNRIHFSGQYNNPVDACVAMIKKLNELKML